LWDDPENWESSSVPIETDHVCIEAGAKVKIGQKVESVQSEGTLEIESAGVLHLLDTKKARVPRA
jgi:hypothetical protein